jgi:hypothetical protein
MPFGPVNRNLLGKELQKYIAWPSNSGLPLWIGFIEAILLNHEFLLSRRNMLHNKRIELTVSAMHFPLYGPFVAFLII